MVYGNGRYAILGSIGALVGANFALWVMGLTQTLPDISTNHILESIFFIGIVSVFYEIFARTPNLKIFEWAFLAWGLGAIWEVLSFGKAFDIGEAVRVLIVWFAYATPIVFIIGPMLLTLIWYLRKKQVVMGIRSVGRVGLAIVFFSAFALAAIMLWVLVSFGMFALTKGLVGI